MLVGASSQLSGPAFVAVVLVTSTALVAGLAWASRRLLGLPVGALRALIAGLLGFAAALLLGGSLRAAQPGAVAAPRGDADATPEELARLRRELERLPS